jgi:hypothetical protein
MAGLHPLWDRKMGMSMFELLLKQMGIDPVALTAQFKETIDNFQEEHRKLQHIMLAVHDRQDMMLVTLEALHSRLERMEIVLLNIANGEGSSYAEMMIVETAPLPNGTGPYSNMTKLIPMSIIE